MNLITLTPEQSRWARGALSLSQRQLSNDSGKSLSYIKQFETGRFSPGQEFQSGLRTFFEGRGVDFAEFTPPDSAEVVAQPGEPRRVARRVCFYAAPDLREETLTRLFDMIDGSVERLAPLLASKVKRGFFGDTTQQSDEVTRRVFGELAVIGLAYGAIAGRFAVEPRLVSDPETQEEIVSNFLAIARGDTHAIVEADAAVEQVA